MEKKDARKGLKSPARKYVDLIKGRNVYILRYSDNTIRDVYSDLREAMKACPEGDEWTNDPLYPRIWRQARTDYSIYMAMVKQ